MSVSIFIDPRFRRRVSRGWLREVAERVLEMEQAPRRSLSLVLANDSQVRQLNRRYLGKKGTTDVLSFPLSGNGFPPPADQLLGEVVISLPQAERQAVQYQHPLPRELALLVIHGILHLLGYDDTQPEAEARMRREEARLLETLGELGPIPKSLTPSVPLSLSKGEGEEKGPGGHPQTPDPPLAGAPRGLTPSELPQGRISGGALL